MEKQKLMALCGRQRAVRTCNAQFKIYVEHMENNPQSVKWEKLTTMLNSCGRGV